MREGFFEIGGRLGFFLAVNEDGFESDVLTRDNADSETERLLGARRLVWRFCDGSEGAEVGPAPLGAFTASRESREAARRYLEGRPDERGRARAEARLTERRVEGAWAACERWLMEREASAAETGSRRRI